MKAIVFLLAVVCFAITANAQQKNNAELPPIRTTDPVPMQRKTAATLPMRKDDIGTRQQATTSAATLPIRKSDMSGGEGSNAANNKAAQDNKSGVTMPSSTAAPSKSKDNQSKNE